MKLNRGINLGGYLSQCEHNREHHLTFIQKEDIQAIAKMGFDHVRIPIDYEVLEDETGNTIEEGYKIVDRMINYCREEKLEVILDLHKAYGYDFNNAGNEELNNLFSDEKLQDRFVNLWKKIAGRFAKYDFVAFELLNEVVEKENADAWNQLIKKTVKGIREIAATAPIIYGGIQWNSVKTLKLLDQPMDENIILTFHFYEPLLFTHQKAHWVPTMDPKADYFYPETMEYYRENSKRLGYQGEVAVYAESETMGTEFIEEMVNEAILAAKERNAKLYCGEFGVIDQAPIADTLRWFKDVDSVFRKYNIGCSVWTYKEMDFGLIGDHYKDIKDDLLTLWNGK